MTRNRANILCCSILTTLAELRPTDWAPSSPMYSAAMAQGFTLDDYHTVLQILEASQMIVQNGGSTVRITDAGRTMAAKIMEVVTTKEV